MEDKARKIGLEINESKTKYMIMSTSERRKEDTTLKSRSEIIYG
jgi:hypothetical protein